MLTSSGGWKRYWSYIVNPITLKNLWFVLMSVQCNGSVRLGFPCRLNLVSQSVMTLNTNEKALVIYSPSSNPFRVGDRLDLLRNKHFSGKSSSLVPSI